MNEREPESKLECHRLSTAEQCPPVLDQLIELSRKVFDPTLPTGELDPSHQRKDVWEEHITATNAKIFYATNTSSTKPEEPIGFLFTVPRTQPEIGVELLHIWLAAVHPESRGLGVFPLLLESVKEHARKQGYSELTVCTYPSRFNKMYRILCSSGWELVAWPIENEKVLMKMKL